MGNFYVYQVLILIFHLFLSVLKESRTAGFPGGNVACGSHDSNAMYLRRIRLNFNRLGEDNGSPETFPATCARARFAGYTFLRRITLALKTVQCTFEIHLFVGCLQCNCIKAVAQRTDINLQMVIVVCL